MGKLPEFHPATPIRDWRDGNAFTISDALTGVIAFGATGSGKTSGVAKHLAIGYMAAGFGGLVLCAKLEERAQWEQWAKAVHREQDLIIIKADGNYRFNFLDWEASRKGEGAGLTINVVALLDNIAEAIAGSSGKQGGSEGDKFFDSALHHMNTNLVDLVILAGLPVTLPLLSSIISTAPVDAEQVESDAWRQDSTCWATIKEAERRLKATKDLPQGVMEDFEECKKYWTRTFPNLAEKTRSIVTLSFAMLVQPFITRPLRQMFSSDTNITPEDAFNGKIIIIDLPIQDFKLTGRVAALAWKYCFQVAVMRRVRKAGFYLRPVFLWADEAQNVITRQDYEYQAVARSAGGCTVYLIQNRESMREVVGSNDSVDSLLGNLQSKFFCQNSGETNEWASKLLGERYTNIIGTGINHGEEGKSGGNINMKEEKRAFVEPSRFTTLKRGGEIYANIVESIVYKGGTVFENEMPYKLLAFKQI